MEWRDTGFARAYRGRQLAHPRRDLRCRKIMERQAGLGRSLEDVLDSLTPPESDPSPPQRALFEPEDLEQQLDQLMGDIRDLRERVQHLVGMVPDDAVLERNDSKAVKSEDKKKKKKRKKKKRKAEQKALEHHAERNGSVSRKTNAPKPRRS
jgi:TolA-binding protein